MRRSISTRGRRTAPKKAPRNTTARATTLNFLLGERRHRLRIEELEPRRMLAMNPFGNFATDLESKVSAIESSVDGVFSTLKSIPFVGQNLGGLSAVQSFLNSAGQKIQSELNNIGNVSLTATELSTEIYDALGQPGLNVLGGANGSNTAAATDVHVTNFTLDSSNTTLATADVELRIHVAPVAVSQSLAFNLGLPALPFKITATGGLYVNVGFDYELAVDFTSSPAPGQLPITLDASKKLSDFSPSMSNNQLVFGITAGFTGSPSLTATVGILNGTLSPTPNTTNQLAVNITVNNLDLTQAPSINFNGSANVNLTATLGFGNGNGASAFPGISTTLTLVWGNLLAAPTTLEFGDVQLDLGEFLSDLVGPIVQDIQQFTQPIQGAINFLNQPIPGLDQIPDLSTYSLMNLLSEVADVTGFGPIATIVTTAETIITAIDKIDVNSLTGVMFPMGDFDLNGGDIENDPPALDPSVLSSDLGDSLNDALSAATDMLNFDSIGAFQSAIQSTITNVINGAAQQLGSAGPAAAAALNLLADSVTGGAQANAAISFPLFSDPSTILNLLFGQDPDLVKFTASFNSGQLAATYFVADAPIGPVSASVSLVANPFHAAANLTIGYDTYGIRELVSDLENGNDSAATIASAVGDGFFIQGPGGSDPATYVNIGGTVGLQTGVTVGIPGASVTLGPEGDVSGDVNLSMNNAYPDSTHDGKIRLSELLEEIQNDDVFVVSGNLTAGFDLKLNEQLGPFGASQTLISGPTVTLWDSAGVNASVATSTPPPTITEISPASGPMGGGTTVEIYGTNLENATRVDFIGAAVPGTIVADTSTCIEVMTPPGNAADTFTSYIQLVTPTGETSYSTSDSYTYIAPPTITSVSPGSGPAAGNEVVELQGTNLSNASEVNFGTFSGSIDNDPAYRALDNATTLYVISPRGSGDVDVSVTTPGGPSVPPADQFVDPDAFTYIPAPNIEYIEPAVGPLVDEQQVAIYGTNLQELQSVSFGSVKASMVSYGGFSNYSVNQAGTEIMILAPVQTSAGAVTVTATTAGGTSDPNGTYDIINPGGLNLYNVPDDAQFTYFAVPVVTSVSPVAGTLSGISILGLQSEATITGTGLGPMANATVDFGSNPTTIISDVKSANSNVWTLTVDVPAGAAGTVDVRVTTPGGESAIARPADAYTYQPPPTVTDVLSFTGLATVGPLGGGTEVNITGTNLQNAIGVMFGTSLVSATSVFVNQNGVWDVFAYSPMATTAGPVSVQVLTLGGLSPIVTIPGGQTSPTDEFTYVPPPVPGSMSATSGPFEGGNPVTITGTSLGNAGDVTVDFGLSNPATIVSDNGSMIVVTAPYDYGTNPSPTVTITTPDGTSSAGVYNYVTVPPTISSLTPSTGAGTIQTQVIIAGQDLLEAQVWFGGVQANILQYEDLFNQITVLAPLGTNGMGANGIVPVTVMTPSSRGSQTYVTSNSLNFTYATGVAVTRVSPNSGPVFGGNQITISGTDFNGVLPTGVRFGGTPAVFTLVNPTTIDATVPLLGPGTFDVTVTGTDGTSPISQPVDQYSLGYPAPTVTIVSPTSDLPGQTVNIYGTNLESFGTSGVYFGTVKSPYYQAISDNELMATVPGSVTGPNATVDVTVQSDGGTSGTSSADLFTYGADPTITGLQFSSGSPGMEETIYGANLQNATSVYFSDPAGAQAEIVSGSDSANQITVFVPNFSGTQDVHVVTQVGSNTLTSATTPADEFTYTWAPIVTAVTGNASLYALSEGPTTGGTAVTIDGYNLVFANGINLPLFGNETVTFGGVPATSYSYTYTGQNNYSLTAISPAGMAGTVPVTVSTDFGSASSQFTYLAVPSVSGLSPAAGPLAGNNELVISGSGLADDVIPADTQVYFGGVQGNVTDGSDGAIYVVPPAGTGTGTVDVTVTTPGGSVTDPQSYTYLSPPTVTGLSQTSGAIEGGTQVTITGTELGDATQVLFQDPGTGEFGPATILSDSDDQITVLSPYSPINDADTVDVIVTAYDGTSLPTTPDEFTYTHAPYIDSMSTPSIPGSVVGGPIAGGTTLYINGADFTGATQVNFGSTPAATFSVEGNGTIMAVSPAGNAGLVDVTVTTPLGTTDISPADQFVFAAMPTISGISPATGSIATATQVTITGSGLGFASEVDFDGVPATIISDSDGQLVVTSPNTGYSFNGNPFTTDTPYDITVTTPAGTSARGPQDQFTFMPVPEIYSEVGTAGSVYGGTTVTITGSGLAGATVDFGANPATILSNTDNNGSDTIVALTPEATGDSPGDVTIIVTTPYGTSYAFNQYSQIVYFLYALPSTVTGISQSRGPLGGGSQITITGTNLDGVTAVNFGQNAVTNGIGTIYGDDTELFVNVPASSDVGTVDITVTANGGTTATTPADQYTYVAAPAVTGVSPNIGPQTGGTQVTLYGTGFLGATEVDFNDGSSDYAVGIPGNTSDTQLVVTTPAFPAYSYPDMWDITVTSVGGVSAKSSADRFTDAPAPTVSSISPATGYRAGGDVVTIDGSNLDSAFGVDFGVNPGVILSQSYSQIVAQSPAGSDGTVDITAIGLGGTSTTSTADQFTYIQPAPVLTGLSASTGLTTGGTLVTITGSDLDNITEVDFGGVAGVIQSGGTATQISVASPANGTGEVDVTVTTVGGTSATNPSDQFLYVTPPTVTSLGTPTDTTTGGSTVYIYGTDLDNASAVSFGNSPGTIVFDAGTYLVATDPAHAAGTVDVTVTNANGTSGTSSADLFTYVAPPTAVAASYSVPENTTVYFDSASGVLANDVDPQGDSLSASLLAGPMNGALSLYADGSFYYTPNGGFFGTDTFTYEATNGVASSSSTTVTLTVNPATLTWTTGVSGNWTDPQWSGTSAYPDKTVNASVAGSGSVVNITTDQATNAMAIGASAQVVIGPGAVLAVTTDTSVTGSGSLNVDPNGLLTTEGTMTVATGGIVSGGPVVAGSYQLNDGTISANLGGLGGVTESGSGTVTLSGSNSYAGATTVGSGMLIIVGANALPLGSSLVIGSAAAPGSIFSPPASVKGSDSSPPHVSATVIAATVPAAVNVSATSVNPGISIAASVARAAPVQSLARAALFSTDFVIRGGGSWAQSVPTTTPAISKAFVIKHAGSTLTIAPAKALMLALQSSVTNHLTGDLSWLSYLDSFEQNANSLKAKASKAIAQWLAMSGH